MLASRILWLKVAEASFFSLGDGRWLPITRFCAAKVVTSLMKGIWNLLRQVRFPLLSAVSALLFLYRQPRPEGPFEGSQNFSGGCIL